MEQTHSSLFREFGWIGCNGPLTKFEGFRETNMIGLNHVAVQGLSSSFVKLIPKKSKDRFCNLVNTTPFQPVSNKATHATAESFAVSLRMSLSLEIWRLSDKMMTLRHYPADIDLIPNAGGR